MTPKTIILLISTAAALSAPAVGSAQSYYQQQYRPQPYYGQRGGDYYNRRRVAFRGYPEFRSITAHIRSEIDDGVNNDLLAADDAAAFNQQLRNIQARELREYRVHGWNLPESDRADIRSQLDDLDRLVDQTRDEP